MRSTGDPGAEPTRIDDTEGPDGDTGGPGPDGAPGADDAALLAELGDLLRVGAEPPAEVLESARQIYAWRTVDAELAALTFDSLLDAEPSRSRAGEQARTLTFEARALAIELEVDTDPQGRRLLGQLVPPQVADVELRVDGRVVAATADEVGRFTLPLRAALQRVVVWCRLPDGTEVVSAAAVV